MFLYTQISDHIQRQNQPIDSVRTVFDFFHKDSVMKASNKNDSLNISLIPINYH